MDLSDGLLGDAVKMARAAGARLSIDCDKVPLSEAARAALKAGATDLTTLLAGGDDYELLFAAPPIQHEPLMNAAAAFDFPLACVGSVKPGQGVGAA